LLTVTGRFWRFLRALESDPDFVPRGGNPDEAVGGKSALGMKNRRIRNFPPIERVLGRNFVPRAERVPDET
jgi:hypothetical protein